MKFIILISSLVVFSLIGTSFAITPVYYSEDKCDIDKDLKRYREILQNDIVVKTFMQKYPDAASFPAGGIDDSDPPQTSVIYVYENNNSTTRLTIRIFGYLHDKSNCFAPFSYAIQYQDRSKTIQIINYEGQTQEILDFLKGTQNQSPASILLHSGWSAFPVVIDQYQYYVPYKTAGTSIGGMFPNCMTDSFLVPLDRSSDGKITIAMPRYVLDAKDGNNDVDYIIILDDEEADFKEIQADSQFRVLEIQTRKDSRNLKIYASSTMYQTKEPNCGIKKAPQYNTLLTPIQQFKAGIPSDRIQCREGLTLILKAENESPACVKSQNRDKFVERNWTNQKLIKRLEIPLYTRLANAQEILSKSIGKLPITGVGGYMSKELEVMIHEDELKKNPDAKEYYEKIIKDMLPFDVPVKITFGHAIPLSESQKSETSKSQLHSYGTNSKEDRVIQNHTGKSHNKV